MKKKTIILAMICCVLAFTLTAQAVEPRWAATLRIVLTQEYFGLEGLYCSVEVTGRQNVTSIQNVDVTVSQKVGNDWVVIDSWLDMSVVGNFFLGEFIAPDGVPGNTYRLKVTADVYYDGTYETVESYMDRDY